jgi:predicted MFS family arabinose efflux permease
MLQELFASLTRWNLVKTERQKLQHIYLVLTVAIVVAAGIASFFDATLGHRVVLVALVTLGAFAVNAVVWNLLQSALLEKLTTKPKTTRK